MRTLALFSLLCLTGCLGSNGLGSASVAENNISNLSRISLGMSETEVFRIMRGPHSKESYQFNNDAYDVWFYVTRMTALAQTRMVPLNLTPLTFKNGILVGCGFAYYNHVVKQHAIEEKIEASEPKDLKKPKSDDIKLEKTLESTPLPKGSVPQPKTSKDTTIIQEGERGYDLTMSKKPAPEEDPSDPSPLDEKDEKMIEEENEQNFDYW